MAEPIHHLYRQDNLVDVLRMLAIQQPEKIAVTIGSIAAPTDVTYKGLLERGARAGALISQFSKTGDRVILALPTSVHFLDFFMGCLITKRIPVPLPVEKITSRFSRFSTVMADANPSVLVCESASDFEKICAKDTSNAKLMKSIFVSDLGNNDLETGLDLEHGLGKDITENSIAFIQYTSGSTNNPKGVVLTHKNVVANIRMILEAMKVTAIDRIVSWLPLHHDMGLIGMFLAPLCAGAWTRIYPYQEFARHPLSWLKECAARQATLSGAPNFAFDVLNDQILQREVNLDMANIRLLYSGSERIAPGAIQRFFKCLESTGLNAKAFFPCYGLAEASLLVSGSFVHPEALSSQTTHPTCGTIANGLTVTIKDEKDERLAPHEIGRIFVSGPSISHGYWSDLAKTINDGDMDHALAQQTRALDTGDLGYVLGGELFVAGRVKDLIKVRGKNIYPDDVEALVEQESIWFPPGGVVAASTSSGENETMTIVAEVRREKRRDNLSIASTAIYDTLSSLGLAPDRVVLVGPLDLPKTSSGKKQRRLTAELLRTQKLEILWDSNNATAQTVSARVETSKKSDLIPIFEELTDWATKINFNLADERRTFPANFLLHAHQIGLLGLLVPKEHGGLGLDSSQFAEMGRRLGQVDFSLAAMIGNHNTIGILPIVESKVHPARESILKEIVQRGKIVAFAITEPSAGSNPRAMTTTATPASNGFSLTGEKVWIGNGNIADYVNLFVKEFDSKGNEIGISAFLLDRRKHRYEVSEEQLTFGLKAMPQTRLILRDVTVGDEDRLSDPGKGLAMAFNAMEYTRFALAATSVGAVESALQICEAFISERTIWTGPHTQNQNTLRVLWRTKIKKDALWSLVKRIGESHSDKSKMPTDLSLLFKILAGEWTFSSVDDLLQMCGGRGYTEPFGLARIQRDVRVIRIFEGPTEAMAFQLGSAILRKPDTIDNIQSVLGFQSNRLKNSLTQLTKSDNQTYNSSQTFAIDVGIRISELIGYESLIAELAAGDPRATVANHLADTIVAAISALPLDSHLKYPELKLEGSGLKAHSVQQHYDSWVGTNVGTKHDKSSELRETARSKVEPTQDRHQELPASTSNNLLDLIDLRLDLTNWLKTHRRLSTVDPATPLTSYGVDSLLGYELLCYVEDTFGVTLPEAIIANRPSINDLAEKIIASSSIKKNTQSTRETAATSVGRTKS
jgi:acyl-CoA synthetase (AMP-forming)/AMP-acid ligase II/alkylation response protein AidB-like acyl-CoA dehydrogenase/acyl carrier protein